MTRALDMARIVSGNFAIPSGSLGNAVPADGSISTAKLADDAVTSAKLADNSVVTAAINADAITSAKIADDAVVAAAIADDAVGSAALATNSVGADAIGDAVVGTTQLAAAAVTDAKLDQTLGTLVKLTNIDLASNTQSSMTFHSVFSSTYQVYKIFGKIGGTTNTGNANMGLRWVTGTGTVVSTASYHSANAGNLSDNNFNTGSGLNSNRAFILVHTSTGTTNFVEMTLVPSIRYGYGFIHTHDQSTHIGMTSFGFKYNAGLSNITGIQILPSGGNMTECDFTVYGMKLSGSMGG